jgi:hypothetical protein
LKFQQSLKNTKETTKKPQNNKEEKDDITKNWQQIKRRRLKSHLARSIC